MSGYDIKKFGPLLDGAMHPVLIADERIDGDALGATLAIATYFRERGIVAPVIVSAPVPEKYQFLPGIDQCTTDKTRLHRPEVDLVIVCDCSDAEYVAALTAGLAKDVVIVNIDHHETNNGYGDLCLVDKTASAACAVVHRLFEQNQLTISKDAATCLLTGLCFDTTVFSNSGADEHAFEIASKLALAGADVQEIIRLMYGNRRMEALRVWGLALERLGHSDEHGCLVTYITQDDLERTGASEEEIEGLSNFLNFVCQESTLCVFRETTTGVKASLRSSVIDVAALARERGGGGHKRAAGYTIDGARLAKTSAGTWEITPAV